MSIKFLTLNVEHGGKYMDNVLVLLDRIRPDIFFLQEVYNSKNSQHEKRFRTVDVISEKVKEYMPFHDFKGYAYDPDIPTEMGNAIFSKFEIEETNNFFFDQPYKDVTFNGVHEPPTVPRALQWAMVNAHGKRLNLCNLHGIWAIDGLDSPRRIQMAEQMVKVLKHKNNIILAGDTNFDTKAFETIRIIESAGIKSVFEDSLISTFNMNHKTDPGYATACVDMVFISPEFKVEKKEMPMDDVSDHRPLYVELSIDGA